MPSTEARKVSVLIVDDEPDNRKMLSLLLRTHEHEVTEANCGQAALDAISGCSPDVILLDVKMPGMDGYEVARRIRTDYADCRATLVAVTGLGDEQHKVRASEAGFQFHLLKPIDFKDLENIMAALGSRDPK
jgi:CheY-like chemotaxis protein